MADYLELSNLRVGLATAMVLVNAVISIFLRLKLEGSLLVASLRTILQLTLIGFALEIIFAESRPGAVIGFAIFMTIAAGWTAVSRLKRSYRGIWLNTVLSMWVSSWFIGLYAVTFVLQGIEPWYQAQYVIPILGMILGNTLNGISIGLDTILDAFVSRRLEIETRLSLGASRWEACRPEVQHAVRNGMMPIINSMMIVGLVSLPGMMTGQLLSGTAPIDAIKYQITIMFLIASATGMGTVIAILLATVRVVNAHHQLEAWRLTTH